MAADLPNHVKVLFRDGEQVETLWAEQVGPTTFRLDNAPFFAYGVSADDIVEGSPTEFEGMFEFRNVVRRSGAATLRLAFLEPGEVDHRDEILATLLQQGCAYEGMNPKYIAVTVPPGVSLNVVTEFLSDRGINWEYGNNPNAQ